MTLEGLSMSHFPDEQFPLDTHTAYQQKDHLDHSQIVARAEAVKGLLRTPHNHHLTYVAQNVPVSDLPDL